MQELLDHFTKFGRKVAHGLRNKPLDFGSNQDHAVCQLSITAQISKSRRPLLSSGLSLELLKAVMVLRAVVLILVSATLV